MKKIILLIGFLVLLAGCEFPMYVGSEETWNSGALPCYGTQTIDGKETIHYNGYFEERNGTWLCCVHGAGNNQLCFFKITSIELKRDNVTIDELVALYNNSI